MAIIKKYALNNALNIACSVFRSISCWFPVSGQFPGGFKFLCPDSAKCLLCPGAFAHIASLAIGHQHPALPCAAEFSAPQAALAETHWSRPQAPCLLLDSAPPAPGPALTTVPGALRPPQPGPYCVWAGPCPQSRAFRSTRSPYQTAAAGASGLKDKTGPQGPTMSFLETLALSFGGWVGTGEETLARG